jgi:hypothetical protein
VIPCGRLTGEVDQMAAAEEVWISLIVMPAPMLHTNIERTEILSEPHHLYLPDADLRLTGDCGCEICERNGVETLTQVSGEALAANLLENGVTGLELQPHRDLFLLGPGGEPTGVAQFLNDFAGVVRGAGLTVAFVAHTPMEPGTWVRIVAEAWVAPDHVIVPGQLGQVQQDDWGICTPGISAYVLLKGRKEPYGYLDELLEPLREPPSEEEIKGAEALTRRSLEIFEETNGFSGYLKLGKGRPKTVEEARREIAVAVERLATAEGADRRGLIKRVRKVLAALSERAGDARAGELLVGLSSAAGSDGEEVILQGIGDYADGPVG